ncbi:hypothetical protein BRCON_1763 [Candidatus Sumerlaea chitinivorans]|uniref:Uncharacterized protein n=1 Tax=Sumerlaea chitinivorans TaxID=2250252 RepID=A0A2Z4Y5U6_SUMC1|nr:hypothetical protein BRCON_1763 [Candidatus Sumerlaea chitinivorans]
MGTTRRFGLHPSPPMVCGLLPRSRGGRPHPLTSCNHCLFVLSSAVPQLERRSCTL